MSEPDRIVREGERRRLTGLCRQTWAVMEREGKAPCRVVLSGNRVGWRLSQVLEWIESRQPKSDDRWTARKFREERAAH